MARLSRRNFLVSMAAACAFSAGAAYFWTRGADALVEAILVRRLPGVRIDKASIAALSRDIQADRFHSFARKFALGCGAFAASIVGIDAVSHFGLTSTQFAQLERLVITVFIFGSNYLT